MTVWQARRAAARALYKVEHAKHIKNKQAQEEAAKAKRDEIHELYLLNEKTQEEEATLAWELKQHKGWEDWATLVFSMSYPEIADMLYKERQDRITCRLMDMAIHREIMRDRCWEA